MFLGMAIISPGESRPPPDMVLGEHHGISYLLSWTRAASGPLVVFLHGVGERGHDGLLPYRYEFFRDEQAVLSLENIKNHGASLLIPQCPRNDHWVKIKHWGDLGFRVGPEPTPALASVLDLVEDLSADPRVDRRRVYLLGLSMGAYGAFELAARRPGEFAATVGICGGGDVTKAEVLAKSPLFFVHGALDTVVPSNASLELAQAVRGAGGEVVTKIYPDLDHIAWNRGFADPDLKDWLWRQQRAP